MVRVVVVLISVCFFAVVVYSADRNPADLDGSGRVDFADFVIFAENFGKTGAPFDPAARDTTIIREVIRDTILITGGERPEEGEWRTIFARERRNIYWLGVGVLETGYIWAFVGTGFAVTPRAICTNVHVVIAMQEIVDGLPAGFTPVFVAIPAGARGWDGSALMTYDSGDIQATYRDRILTFWHPEYDETAFSPDVAVVFTSSDMPSFCRLVSSLNSMELEVGDEIGTMGYPGEMSSNYNPDSRPIPTSKTGSISALRPYSDVTFSEDLWGFIANKVIQHDFDTTGGTSGSPIFNMRGEVVGIHNAGFESGSLSFGIRADEARDLLRAIYIRALKEDPNVAILPDVLVNLTKPTVNH